MSQPHAKLIVFDQEMPLSKEVVRIGRGADNDVVIENESVSVHHAVIRQNDGSYHVQDLGSTNGTTVNGESVTTANLGDSAAVGFGSVICSFLESQKAPPATFGTNGADCATSHHIEEQKRGEQPTIWSRLAGYGKSAIKGTKKGARLAALRTNIEKVKRIDLRQAHSALGRKCYELRMLPEQFATAYLEIEKLEVRIADKRKGVHAAEGAKAGDKLQAFIEDQASKAAGGALGLKLNQLFVELGRVIAGGVAGEMPIAELLRVRDLEQRIAALDGDVVVLRGDSKLSSGGAVAIAAICLVLIGIIPILFFWGDAKDAIHRTFSWRDTERTHDAALVRFEVGSLFGFKDSQGRTVMPPQFDYATEFEGDKAFVCANGGYGYIDRNGQFLGREPKGSLPTYNTHKVLVTLASYTDITSSKLASMVSDMAKMDGGMAFGQPGPVGRADGEAMVLAAIMSLHSWRDIKVDYYITR